jgi:hypothetical protein
MRKKEKKAERKGPLPDKDQLPRTDKIMPSSKIKGSPLTSAQLFRIDNASVP